MPLLGAIAGCHCSVVWWGEGGGAIAGCQCSVLDGRRPTLREWTWCHCWVGANFCFISSSYIQGHQFHPDTRENNNEFCLELLADVTLFSTLITEKLVLAIWGLCWYNFLQNTKCSKKYYNPLDDKKTRGPNKIGRKEQTWQKQNNKHNQIENKTEHPQRFGENETRHLNNANKDIMKKMFFILVEAKQQLIECEICHCQMKGGVLM